jgi:hypothetical protein
MRRPTSIAAGVSWLALATVQSPCADFIDPAPQTLRADEELDEVLVLGKHAREQRPGWEQLQQPFDWLSRLAGRFVVDGHVDLHATGDTRGYMKVAGRAECVGFGIAPAVTCELKIRLPRRRSSAEEGSPGGIPNLDTAVVLYGYDLVESGINFLLVDGNGNAEGSVGLIVAGGDVMQARSRCSAPAGTCERLVTVTAKPDLKVVEMQMDLEVDGRTTSSLALLMHRVPGTPSIVYGRKGK